MIFKDTTILPKLCQYRGADLYDVCQKNHVFVQKPT